VETKDIHELIRSETGYEGEITDQTTLYDDLGVYGDDMTDLLAEYSKRFQVDMSKYLWYFHNREEGWSFGGAFFLPPNERVKQILQSFGVPELIFSRKANEISWQYQDYVVVFTDGYVNKAYFS
jgi:hypothetical protein